LLIAKRDANFGPCESASIRRAFGRVDRDPCVVIVDRGFPGGLQIGQDALGDADGRTRVRQLLLGAVLPVHGNGQDRRQRRHQDQPADNVHQHEATPVRAS
jgi:hypothetical protein